jgi:hypothetical protein
MHKMKLSTSKNLWRLTLSFILFSFFILLFESCARKISFMTSSVVPAAEGTVKLKKDNNNNYNVSLEVMRLAEPERLQPPKDNYVVWMNTEQNGTQNIGKLETSSGLLSKTLKSSLETVTPFKPSDFFITAEDDAVVQYPSGQVVLRTKSIR